MRGFQVESIGARLGWTLWDALLEAWSGIEPLYAALQAAA